MTTPKEDPNAQNAPQENKEDQTRRPPYTMNGVLHYLQHEWSVYEMDRAKWDIERAEMQARISFLQGERKGQENLKTDLIRRIKMLEYCVRQERAKNYRLMHNGEDPPEYEETGNEPPQAVETAAVADTDAYMGDGSNSNGWKQGRQLLKQYLQEIGYSETILDVRQFRVKHLLGLISEGDWPSSERGGGGKQNEKRHTVNEDDSDQDDKAGEDLDAEATEALGEFDFLNHKDDFRPRDAGKDDWAATDQHAIARLTEKYKLEKHRSKRSSGSEDEDMRMNTAAPAIEEAAMPAPKGKRGNFLDINEVLGLPGDVDIKDTVTNDDDDSTLQVAKWTTKATLRSHLDSIRAMQFHPVEPVLITASEDGTVKLWNLEAVKKDEKHSSPNGVTDVEPVYTFRGHNGPVLCLDLSPTGDQLFTGGLDGVICCWNMPSSQTDPHEAYDPRILIEKLRGHLDAVWAVAYHSSDNRLVSASSDGTIKLWEPGNFGEPLLRTIEPPSSGCVPTSVDFVSTEPCQLLAAYTHSQARIIDMETGDVVMSFDLGEAQGDELIARIQSHPTMPITILAQDRRILYLDNNTGKVIHSAVAHVEGISCLAIDPNGLYILSASHDGSLRLWNMEKRVCLQEISAHRKKYDASVTCVAFHPSRPLIGSAGADSLAKVYSMSVE